MPDNRCIIVRISGRVQGVGFRDWTQRKANELGLSGWVRNLPGGQVEALFSGPADVVDAMVTACRRGPQSAQVDQVRVTDEAAEPATGAFSARYR